MNDKDNLVLGNQPQRRRKVRKSQQFHCSYLSKLKKIIFYLSNATNPMKSPQHYTALIGRMLFSSSNQCREIYKVIT